MIKRTLITGIILFSFLITSINAVSAIYSETFTDDVEDVVKEAYTDGDVVYENITDKPYLDIIDLTVSRDYRRVTLKLTLGGTVRNLGDIRLLTPDYLEELIEKVEAGEIEEDEVLALLMEDVVSYTINVASSENNYLVIYVNEDIRVYDLGDNLIEALSPVVNDNILTISFNLPSSKENLSAVEVFTNEGGILGLSEINYYDTEGLSGICNDESPLSNNGDSNGDSGSDLTLFIILIAIMVIIGVGVIVYLIRR